MTLSGPAPIYRRRPLSGRYAPGRLGEFEGAIDRLRAPTDFQVQDLAAMFDSATQSHVKQIIRELQQQQLKRHELFGYVREVVHGHPEFDMIQRSHTDTVSAMVDEEVELSYSFLSLYKNLRICKVHMDAPIAKWAPDTFI
jgi:hypothetical protein